MESLIEEAKRVTARLCVALYEQTDIKFDEEAKRIEDAVYRIVKKEMLDLYGKYPSSLTLLTDRIGFTELLDEALEPVIRRFTDDKNSAKGAVPLRISICKDLFLDEMREAKEAIDAHDIEATEYETADAVLTGLFLLRAIRNKRERVETRGGGE